MQIIVYLGILVNRKFSAGRKFPEHLPHFVKAFLSKLCFADIFWKSDQDTRKARIICKSVKRLLLRIWQFFLQNLFGQKFCFNNFLNLIFWVHKYLWTKFIPSPTSLAARQAYHPVNGTGNGVIQTGNGIMAPTSRPLIKKTSFTPYYPC